MSQIPTLNNTNPTTEIPKEKFLCRFCCKNFSTERTLEKHLCDQRRRWDNKDYPGNRIGFQSWARFYEKIYLTKNHTDYLDFIKSQYYSAFVKFGIYCVDAKVFQIHRYADYLLDNKIAVDQWNQDSHYTKFLIQYCKQEDPLDALARSIETTIERLS